jgi:hypothetical protein
VRGVREPAGDRAALLERAGQRDIGRGRHITTLSYYTISFQ